MRKESTKTLSETGEKNPLILFLVKSQEWILLSVVAIIFCLLSLQSCGVVTLSERGYTGKITAKGNEYKGELLFVTDSTLYIQTDYFITDTSYYLKLGKKTYPTLNAIPLKDVNEVVISQPANYWWLLPFLAATASTTLIVTSFTNDPDYKSDPGIYLAYIPNILAGIFFLTSSPPDIYYKYPLYAIQIDEMKKYMRFPGGLNEEQMKKYISSGAGR